MKNKAINTIKYTGIVTLSRYDGIQKVKIAQAHNEGFNPLFDFLTDCLVGKFNNNKRPAKIKLLKRELSTDNSGNIIESYQDLTGFIYLLREPDKSSTDSSRGIVRYSFIIPRDYMETLDDTENLGLGLYTNSETDSVEGLKNFAAYCELGLDRNDIAGASLAVDWELIISNLAYYETK